jgi:hypothetical protein
MVANAMGHSFERAVGVFSRERGAGLVRLRTARLDADSVGHRFPARAGASLCPTRWATASTGRTVSSVLDGGQVRSYSRPMPRRPGTDGGGDPQARSASSEYGGPPVACVTDARGRPPSRIANRPFPHPHPSVSTNSQGSPGGDL